MTNYVHKKVAQLHAEEAAKCPATEVKQFDLDSKIDRLPKNKRASDTPSTFGQISRAHEHAIFLQAMSTRFRGLVSVMATGLVAGFVFCLFGINLGWKLVILSFEQEGWLGRAASLLVVAPLILLMIATLAAAVRTFRIDLFGPKDIPIVFNRKTRKVYRYIQKLPVFPSSNNWREFVDSLPKIPRYWLTAFKPWPFMLLIEYDWDSLESESYEQTQLVGKVVQTIHVLQLVARESPTSDKLIGAFTLASPLITGRAMALDMWEHIRRFMEENGPHISPDDKPAPPFPTTFFQAANNVTPAWYFAVAGAIWADWMIATTGGLAGEMMRQPGLTGLGFFALAVVCNFMTALFVFNWLAHKLGQDLTLPLELLADAGVQLDLNKLPMHEKQNKRRRMNRSS